MRITHDGHTKVQLFGRNHICHIEVIEIGWFGLDEMTSSSSSQTHDPRRQGFLPTLTGSFERPPASPPAGGRFDSRGILG
jgi:hypothetical protein